MIETIPVIAQGPLRAKCIARTALESDNAHLIWGFINADPKIKKHGGGNFAQPRLCREAAIRLEKMKRIDELVRDGVLGTRQ